MASPAIQRSTKVREIFRQITAETVDDKDLIFGQIVYILVFYNISLSWLLTPEGFQFILLCRVYCATVKTKNRESSSVI